VPTVRSSTEPPVFRHEWIAFRRAAHDVIPLLQFRAAALRGPAKTGAALALSTIVVISVIAAWLPSQLDGAGTSKRADVIHLHLPAACAGALLLLVIAAVSGGGRELLPREQAVAFPVSPTTDHLGALLMAPLNIAWLVQLWALLGANAYARGSEGHLVAAQLPLAIWFLAATVVAQAVAWAADWIRRGRGGIWLFRAVAAGLSAYLAALLRSSPADRLGAPMTWIVRGADRGADDHWIGWLVLIVVLLALLFVMTGLGAAMAHHVARRPARDELHTEVAHHPARDDPASDLAALVRVDRAGIWRSVPIRRGFFVLAVLPGLLALAGDVHWETVCILPGPIASAAALLFGVNSWSLDGRGALWRDSLPASPGLVFASRGIVLFETVLLGLVISIVLATLRAGLPTLIELLAVLCAIVVGSLQVVSSSLRWSVQRPFAVDMRSARATPAPPLVMVGYSSRLAFSTTLTGLSFALTAAASHWYWSLVLAAPLVTTSVVRLRRASRRWADPQVRSRVVTTVAS
jgi:hypothetical protein